MNSSGNKEIARDEMDRRIRELEKQLQHYRLIADHSTDMISSHDAEGNYLYVSPACRRLLGYAPEELVGRSAYEFFHPEDLEAVRVNHRRIREAPIVSTIAYRIRNRNGGYQWVETTSRTVPDPATGEIRQIIATTRDITERKNAEAALQERTQTLQDILDRAAEGICVCHNTPEAPYVRFTQWNPRMTEITGYTMEEINRLGWYQSLYPDPQLQQQAIRRMEAMRKGEDIRGEEWRATTKTGEEIDLAISTSVVMEQEDEVHVLAMMQDVTERKRAENALRQSEERFRLAFLTSPDAININRAVDGMYLDVNEGFLNIMGYRRDEVLGKTSLELDVWKDPEDRKRLVAGLQQDGFVENLEAEFVDKKGRVHIGLMSARLLRMDNEDVILSITRDITHRVRVQEELQHSEERYRSLVENTLDGFFVCAIPSGRFLFLNQRICEMFGYAMREGLDKELWDVIDTEDLSLVRKRIQDRMEGRQPRFTSNVYTVICKDGSRFQAEVSTSLITYRGQTVVQGILRDVTEKQRLQLQFQQAQKFEAIGTLAGGVAHDFNNLLMGIQGRASLLGLELEGSSSPREHVAAIEECVRSATHLTKQLLGFARGGKYEVHPVDLNALVSAGTEMFGRTRKEIRIHTKPHPDRLVVEADKQQIEQVLLNVFINAWQAMPAGGDLYIETSSVRFEESEKRPQGMQPGRYAKVSVTDTGAGMDERTRERIFDPFFTTKDKGRGTGLGLASAYGILRNHGGTITVYSEVGHGATFNLYLPASDREVRTERAAEEGLVRGTGTVLLVDDETMIQEVARVMLERLGYRVRVASSGEAAVDMVAEDGESFDLVLLDLIMPGMDGGTAFDRIRRLRPDLPVVLSSGYAVNGQATRILERGCDGFIQKPFNIAELSRKLREILGPPS